MILGKPLLGPSTAANHRVYWRWQAGMMGLGNENGMLQRSGWLEKGDISFGTGGVAGIYRALAERSVE